MKNFLNIMVLCAAGLIRLGSAQAAAQAAAQPPAPPTPPAAPTTAIPPAVAIPPAAPTTATPPAAAAPPATPTHEGVRVLLIPAHETTLVSQMVGTVNNIPTRLGTWFRQGETLITLDCREQRARVRMTEAEHRAAVETHETKRRLQGLKSAGDMEVALAAAARDKAQAQMEATRIEASHCTIVAPFAGRVTKAQARPHQGVGIGAPLLDIVSSEPPRLRLNAPSGWLTWLKPNKAFEVAVDETGKRYPARVTELNARVDAVSQTIEVEGVFTGAHAELLPGMSGLAHFPPPPSP